eukprot:scaffold36311_cov119-Isochrysis_galbana.AAC.2
MRSKLAQRRVQLSDRSAATRAAPRIFVRVSCLSLLSAAAPRPPCIGFLPLTSTPTWSSLAGRSRARLAATRCSRPKARRPPIPRTAPLGRWLPSRANRPGMRTWT